MIAAAPAGAGPGPARFATRSALGYVSGRYGSQKFHRRECGLDPASVVEFLTAEGDSSMPDAARRRRAGHARREDPPPPGADPRARGQRLRRRQPDAVAARRPRGRLRDDHPQARLAARGPARRPRPDGRPADRLEPRRPARRGPAADASSTASPTAPTRSRPTASSSTGRTSTSSPGCCRGWRRGRSPATSTPAARRSTATTPPGRPKTTRPRPNSDYAVSKVAAANLHPLLRQAQAVPLRQPPALLGLRPARGLGPADPQRDPPRPGGDLSRRSSTRPSRATSSTSTT